MYNFILAMAFGSCLFLMLCNSNMFAVMYIYHLTPAIPLLRLKSKQVQQTTGHNVLLRRAAVVRTEWQRLQ